MRIKTSDFPKFGPRRNYAAIRKHFDSVAPWRSKYNPDNERPIGPRACKLTSDGDGFMSGYLPTADDREGAVFNKAMRMLSDGSIAFRLYDTDCVVYHPDDSITVHGWPSVSTNDFISALTPQGISHTCRGRGRDNAYEPVLYLMPIVKRVIPADEWFPKERSWLAPDWSKGMVINCERPVTLHYSVEKRHYVPSSIEALQPFEVCRVDRRHARQVSREYHLAKLGKLINAIAALAPKPRFVGSGAFGPIMAALREERFLEAVQLMPRGESDSFGKVHGTPDGIKPGFMRKLRDHIYDHEGVIDRERVPFLTPVQYARYKADSNRFD